jgi:hypothetical protein
MCTAVVGGLIHRAATSVSAASNQRSATPMANHRTKDRKERLRGGVLVCAVSVTFQNNSPRSPCGWIKEERNIRSVDYDTQAAFFCSLNRKADQPSPRGDSRPRLSGRAKLDMPLTFVPANTAPAPGKGSTSVGPQRPGTPLPCPSGATALRYFAPTHARFRLLW